MKQPRVLIETEEGQEYRNFDFVISDANGVYVVEDSCTSYWDEYGGGNHFDTVMNYFRRLVDDVNFFGAMNDKHGLYHARNEQLLDQSVKQKNIKCRIDIESICFLNSIILITKR